MGGSVTNPNVSTAGTTIEAAKVNSPLSTLYAALNAILGAGNTVNSAGIEDGAIVNADVNASAAIAYSKLSLSGSVAKDDLLSALADVLGVSSTATARRGKSIIATEEARTNTAYGTLTTPDQVANVVLPTDGLIAVAYQATWQESVAAAGRATSSPPQAPTP